MMVFSAFPSARVLHCLACAATAPHSNKRERRIMMFWKKRSRDSVSKPPDSPKPQPEDAGGGAAGPPQDPGSAAARKACTLCGRSLTNPYCDEGHDLILHFAYDDTWATGSRRVADRLIARGYKHEISRSGNLWTFQMVKIKTSADTERDPAAPGQAGSGDREPTAAD